MKKMSVVISNAKNDLSQTVSIDAAYSPVPLDLGQGPAFFVYHPEGLWELKAPESKLSFEVFGLLTHRIQFIPGVKYRYGSFTLEARDFSSNRPRPQNTPWYSYTEEGQALIHELLNTAASRLPIYLQGETGTGKEVLAKMIHHSSPLKNGPFVTLNCGALPLSLAESELFGHRKGSFTGASHQRTGALLQANHGTLFLDEVADLPLEVQVKLLRFLENGEVRAVGSDTTQFAKVRILSATHKPLKKLVAEGKFRSDLYFRLAPITLEVPPLRDRLLDFPHLIRDLLTALAPGGTPVVSPSALHKLKSHVWPGNVRELKHTLERALLNLGKRSSILDESCFQFLFNPEKMNTAERKALLDGPVLPLKVSEKIAIQKALQACHGNRTESAKLLGIARSTLFEMLKRHEITGPKLVKKTPHQFAPWESTDSAATANVS